MLMDKKQQILDVLERGVAEVIDKEHLRARLSGKEKLRIKLGIDPTSPSIHIGRAVALWKLRAFQELGHTAIFIVGDFTGVIGDASDKETERPMLTSKQVNQNMKDYIKQVFKILDPKKTETYYNSEWLAKLGFLELAQMANLFGLNQFTSREAIARRMKADQRVSYLEVMYPLMQGYDSVAVKADVEIGGTDQRFNLLTGRDIQRFYKQNPQDIMMLELLEGTDGRKMSSSWGNVINITDEPNDMYGKVMSINDNLIIRYFKLATDVALTEVAKLEKELKKGTNPSIIKKRLAKEIVTLYHGSKLAEVAGVEFEKVFAKKDKPTEIPSMKVKSKNIVELLVETKLASSKSEARRLVEQGGVKVNDVVVHATTLELNISTNPVTVQVGKRKFVRLRA